MPRKKYVPDLQVDRYFKMIASTSAFNDKNDSIVVWQGKILTGYDQYEYCRENNMKPKIKELQLRNKNEAAAWVASYAYQKVQPWGEYRIYQIGKRYIGMKRAGRITTDEISRMAVVDEYDELLQHIRINRTAEQIAQELSLSMGTVQKYGLYANNIDLLASKNIILATAILQGKIKISHTNLSYLAQMEPSEMRKINYRYGLDGAKIIGFSSQEAKSTNNPPPPGLPLAGIKEMPDYDPDSELAGLAFTVPSWNSSLERAYRVANFIQASTEIKTKLFYKLQDLKSTIEIFSLELEERKHDK